MATARSERDAAQRESPHHLKPRQVSTIEHGPALDRNLSTQSRDSGVTAGCEVAIRGLPACRPGDRVPCPSARNNCFRGRANMMIAIDETQALHHVASGWYVREIQRELRKSDEYFLGSRPATIDRCPATKKQTRNYFRRTPGSRTLPGPETWTGLRGLG